MSDNFVPLLCKILRVMECRWLSLHGITRLMVVLEVLEDMHVQHGLGCHSLFCSAVCTVSARNKTIFPLLSMVRAKHHLCKNYTSKSYLYPPYLLIQSN